jgi:Lrp/AsnC family transcriptional regulator, leucine-responsive regulatory protein
MFSLHDERLLDEIGWHILNELQENARLSFAELGRKVGLSTPAVTERVRKLEDAGVIIGYRTEVDPARTGLPIGAFIRLSVVGEVSARLSTLIQELPEIVECHRTTGADSFIMKVRVSSIAHLEALIDRLTHFGTTTTSMILSSPVTRRSLTRKSQL